MIDWSSQKTEIFFNNRMPLEEQQEIAENLTKFDLKSHIWLSSSGTTAKSSKEIKWVALLKEAILHSAKAVNDHLNCTSDDVWVNTLPIFHIGGLSIFARAYLLGLQVHTLEKWEPHNFKNLIQEKSATLSSLVPAQVYDLVCKKISAPPSLRAIVVGGGALEASLYEKAKELGWKLLPSFGFTECCSQVATALDDREQYDKEKNRENGIRLKVLDHIEAKLNDRGLLCVKSKSLLTGYGIRGTAGYSFIDPKVDSWYETEDRVILKDGYVEVIGRGEGFIKIGGESVYVDRLQKILEGIKLEHDSETGMALFAKEDERLGHVICLALEGKEDSILEMYQSKVMPFERVREVYYIEEIPRSSLSKLLVNELKKLVLK